MQFFVKSLTNKTVTLDVAVSVTTERGHMIIILDVDAFDTIAGVKALILGKEDISSYQLRRIFTGVLLKDDRKHLCYYIREACSLHSGLRLRGRKTIISDEHTPACCSGHYIQDKTITLDVEASDYIFAGMLLKAGREHSGYYIQKACTLHLVLRLCGGMQFPAKSLTDKIITLDVAIPVY